MAASPTVFGTLPDGRVAHLFELRNGRCRASVTEYGATLVSLEVPDAYGQLGPVVLGYPDLRGFVEGRWYLGATCGRFANRIEGACFEIDGTRHDLGANEGANHLHGGRSGFDRALWAANQVTADRTVFTRLSPDGEEGYPGNLFVSVAYSLTEDDGLQIDYFAHTDRATHINLTNHAYFNLSGRGDVRDHILRVCASRYLATGEAGSIPTGEIAPLGGTSFDLGEPTRLGHAIDSMCAQANLPDGIDHCYVLDPDGSDPVAVLEDPSSGRRMEVFTDQPGIQVYTGNYLANDPFARWGGVCLETQHFPDSPNKPQFPSTMLRPGEVFTSRTVYRFKAREAE